MTKIKVIIKRPDEPVGHMTYISNTLKNLQNTVDGPIETVTVYDDLVVICNENGRLIGLPHNCKVRGVDFCGTLIFAGVSGDDFVDITISMKKYRAIFGFYG